MTDLRLYAIVLRLAASRRGAIPADHGDQARAALFDLIKRGDLPLSERLHDTNTQKPYTISLLRGGKRGDDGARHFGEGETAEWRFTLLHEPAFEALLRRYLLNRTLPHLRIGAVEFGIVDAYASGLSHPDSGHVALADLWQRWACDPATLPRAITLHFQSPTTFHLGTEDRAHLWRTLPYPRTLFSVLRKRWQSMGGIEPGDAFDEWVERHIDAEPLSLSTQTVLIEGRPVRGFMGQVRFRQQGDNRWWSLAHLLCDLVYWTGAGYQTTRGMGQARRIED
ncbi:MAG: CRISPR-associated endoribonuclease Cas6 [Anaerolineae bacterium]|nr:CRISPR-associated endoribonuclease Cas6 [Anaerolineae bacterium]